MTSPSPYPEDSRSQGAPAQEGYGGQPAYPGGMGPMPRGNEPDRAEPAPREVQTSVKLWFASIALSLIGAVLGLLLTDRDKAVQSLLGSGTSGITRSQAETAVTVGLVVGLVIVLVLIALEVFFIVKMRTGRNWARITLTVLGALSVLSGLFGLRGGVTFGGLVNLVSILLVAAAIVFMFRPAASAYFSRPKH